jgi:hypothetical protein
MDSSNPDWMNVMVLWTNRKSTTFISDVVFWSKVHSFDWQLGHDVNMVNCTRAERGRAEKPEEEYERDLKRIPRHKSIFLEESFFGFVEKARSWSLKGAYKEVKKAAERAHVAHVIHRRDWR